MLTKPTSQALWEAGVRIEKTEYAWYYSDKIKEWRIFHKNDDLCKGCEWDYCYEFKRDSKISAPSTDDLLRVLPDYYWSGKIGKQDNKYYCWNRWGDTLEEAISQMILWLCKNGWKFDKEKQCGEGILKKEGVKNEKESFGRVVL